MPNILQKRDSLNSLGSIWIYLILGFNQGTHYLFQLCMLSTELKYSKFFGNDSPQSLTFYSALVFLHYLTSIEIGHLSE